MGFEYFLNDMTGLINNIKQLELNLQKKTGSVALNTVQFWLPLLS